MPNETNSNSWLSSDFEKLVELVKPHTFLYSSQDCSRKNIVARESTWEQIASDLNKPVEECKTRWRALRDGYMKTTRLGTWNKTKLGLFKNLEFLSHVDTNEDEETVIDLDLNSGKEDSEQQVITDNQEYYEITLIETPQENKTITVLPKIALPQLKTTEHPIKIGRKNSGRKRSMPMPVNLQPIKILPKPVNVLNGANLVQLVEDTSKVMPQMQPSNPQRSEVLDSLIERVLNEQTNPVDVFFRSMAASVKKLPPSLIPKVKMEVCNVIAKYEMQSFDKNSSNS